MNDLRALFEAAEVDVVVVLSPSNTYYYSGYESSNAQIVVTKRTAYYVTDSRYYFEAAQALGGEFEVICGNLSDVLQGIQAKTIGWDSDVSYRQYLGLLSVTEGRNLVDIGDLIDKQRCVKSAREISLITKAQEVTDRCFEEILPYIREGVSEIDIASRLEYLILSKGCALAFDSIVAFGSNAAVPHAHRSERRLSQGEFVLMDFGAKYQGYCSDMTRTVCLGTPSGRQAGVYESVLQAQQCALDNIKAGLTGAECDAFARETLSAKGLGEYFTHSLGHGLGVDIHEGLAFSPKCQSVIPSGSVMSVEPGVYIDGELGVRIEDIVVIEDDGLVDLTKSNKKLIIL
ncbi:MAG: M24 family metallopeptidase [Christensenellales bacterium]